MKFFNMAFALLVGNMAQAGGWSGSGGGAILEDHSNPWFLTNHSPNKTISYCVHVSEEFPHTSEILDEQIRGAVSFWRESFVTAHTPIVLYEKDKPVRVSIQTDQFVRRNCSLANVGVDGKQEVDIVFQFGILNEFQKQEFKKLNTDLSKFVALSIRSEYDAVTMRGKGFIYISPDNGELAMKGQNLIPKVWTYGCDSKPGELCGISRLGDALRHELGHVFGLQHSNQSNDLMSMDFLERVVTEKWYVNSNQNIFFPRSINISGWMRNATAENEAKFAKFFDLDQKSKDVRLRFSLDQIIVYEKKDADLPWTKVGSAKFEKDFSKKFTDAVRVWLPPLQKVFTLSPNFSKSILGPQIVSLQNTAEYRSVKSNLTRPFMVQTQISSIQLMGTMDGELIADLMMLVNNSGSGWVIGN